MALCQKSLNFSFLFQTSEYFENPKVNANDALHYTIYTRFPL